MASPPEEFSREEVLPLATSAALTDPASLDWAPIAGLFRNTLRLRMNLTEATISEELLEAFRRTRYPDADVPEIRGLVRVLQEAATRAGVPVQIGLGPRELVTGIVSSFQPVRIRLPFARAKLSLGIAPGEIQWVLADARREKGQDSERLETLKREILEGTRAWIRNGNR